MNHEKIIKRNDGSRVKIEVSVYFDPYYSNKPVYRFQSSECKKGKRKFISPHSSNDYAWRSLSSKDRVAYQEKKYLSLCTLQEVNTAYIELWQILKPKEYIHNES